MVCGDCVVEAIHFILLASVPTTIPTNCAHVRIPFETKSPKMLNNPRQRTRFRAFWLGKTRNRHPSQTPRVGLFARPYFLTRRATRRRSSDQTSITGCCSRYCRASCSAACFSVAARSCLASAVPLRSTAKAMNLVIGTEFFSQSGSLHSAAILTPLPLFLRGL